MGLLKKLFFGKKDDAKAEEESSRQPVALRAVDAAPNGKKLPNRSSRIQLHPLHGALFTADDPAFGKPVPLANISSSGLGFLRGTQNQWPEAGAVVNGTLRLADQTVPVSIKLVHVTQIVVGAYFIEPRPELEAQILNYFRLELIAQKMISVNPSALKSVPDGVPHWIYGDNNCEVYFVTQGEKIVRFHLAFFANYIEGGDGLVTQFGQLTNEVRDDRTMMKSSTLVQFDPKVAESLTRAALSFLQNVRQLKPEERLQLIALIQRRG